MTTTGISAYLDQLEVNKNDLMKAVLRLTLEWKDLEEHLDPIQKFSDEYEVKKKDLELYLAERKRELDSVEESLGLRLQDLKGREDDFRSFQMAQIAEIKTREEQTNTHKMWVVQRMEEYELRNHMIVEKEKSTELLLEKFEIDKQDRLELQRSLGEKLNELSQREKRCEDVCEELDSRERKIVLREEELEAREQVDDLIYKDNEMKVQVRLKELDSREIQVELREEELETREKANDLRYSEKEMKIQVRSKELDSRKIQVILREEQLEAREQVNDLCYKENKMKVRLLQNELDSREIQLREEQLKAIQCNEEHMKLFEIKIRDLFKELDTIQKKLNEAQAGELDLRGKQLNLKEEQLKQIQERIEGYCNVLEIKSKSSCNEPAPLREGQPVDLKSNNELEMSDHDSSEVLKLHSERKQAKFALKFDKKKSKTKLIEDTRKLFEERMKTHELKGKQTEETPGKNQFEGNQLGNEPKINLLRGKQPQISLWKGKQFDNDDNDGRRLQACLNELLMFVHLEKQRPEFCSLLGLQEKVNDFIRRLVDKGLHLDAIKYVCAFNVSDDFPPASLLADYINYKQRRYSLKAQETATRKELKALRAVINTVRLHKLDAEYPLSDLIMRVEELEGDGSSTFDFDRKETNEKKRKHMMVEDDADIETLTSYKIPHATDPELDYHHKPSSDCPVGPIYDPLYASQSDIISPHPPLHLTQTQYNPFEPSSDLSHIRQSGTLPLRASPYVTPQPTNSTSIPSHNMSRSYGLPLHWPPHLSAPHCHVRPISNPFYISQSGKLPLQSPPLVTPPFCPLQTPSHLAQAPNNPMGFNLISSHTSQNNMLPFNTMPQLAPPHGPADFITSYTSQNNIIPFNTTPHLAPPHGPVEPTSVPLYIDQSETTILITPPHLVGNNHSAGPGARGGNIMNFWSIHWP